MTEKLKQKAKDFVSKRASGTPKEMDYYAEILAEFATEATKELQEENKRLLESCEGATMLYKDLTEAKEIIRDLLSDIPNRMWYTDKIIQKAEAFLKE